MKRQPLGSIAAFNPMGQPRVLSRQLFTKRGYGLPRSARLNVGDASESSRSNFPNTGRREETQNSLTAERKLALIFLSSFRLDAIPVFRWKTRDGARGDRERERERERESDATWERHFHHKNTGRLSVDEAASTPLEYVWASKGAIGTRRSSFNGIFIGSPELPFPRELGCWWIDSSSGHEGFMEMKGLEIKMITRWDFRGSSGSPISLGG